MYATNLLVHLMSIAQLNFYKHTTLMFYSSPSNQLIPGMLHLFWNTLRRILKRFASLLQHQALLQFDAIPPLVYYLPRRIN
jgi:hypothetical protein